MAGSTGHQGPCGTPDSAPQSALAPGPVVWGSPRPLEASPYRLAGGGAAGHDRVPTPPFPKTVTPSWTPHRVCCFPGKPMQSLSWQVELVSLWRRLQGEPAASRAQQGLPRSPRPGRAPVTHPAPCSCPAPGPASLALLPSCPTRWPNHHLMPKPSPHVNLDCCGGDRRGVRRPGCEFQGHTYWLCVSG